MRAGAFLPARQLIDGTHSIVYRHPKTEERSWISEKAYNWCDGSEFYFVVPNGTRKFMTVDGQLVFDIGLHNGDDSAYYLHLGYRVVGVEANPLLAEQCGQRFAAEIGQKRMTVLNVGILKEPGVFPFFRNLQDSGWSSFDPEKGKKGGEWEQIDIPCTTTGQLIADYGRPWFLKVDIEGADLQALHSLTPELPPAYVSLELGMEDPIVERLIELGYSAFKFVDGDTYRSTPPIFEHETGWRLLRKAGRLAPIARSAIRSLPESMRFKSEWDPPGKYRGEEYLFGAYSSGPFGEKAAGKWRGPEEALRWFTQLKADYRRSGVERTLWWDVHARHSSVNNLP